MAQIGLGLANFSSELERAALQGAADRLNAIIPACEVPFKALAHPLLEQALLNSPTGKSLSGGVLKGELGVVDGPGAIRDIAKAITDNIYFRLEKPVVVLSNNSLDGLLVVGLLEQSLIDIFSLSSASYYTANRKEIPWIDWLLTEGPRVLVAKHRFQGGGNFGKHHSRTGLGIMVRSDSQNWRVPPAFQGTFQDNWLTRTLDNLGPPLGSILAAEITRRWA